MEKKEKIKDTMEEHKSDEIKKVAKKNQNTNTQKNNIDAKEKSNTKTKEEDSIEINERKKIEETKDTNLIKNEDITVDEKKLTKIKEAIKENKEKSKNNKVKNEKHIQIFQNVVIAVMGIAYISINLMGAKRIPQEQYQLDLKVFIILSVISAILLFEKAFKVDKFRYALLGIELLTLGGATIMIMHFYKLQDQNLLKYSKYFLFIWIVYYIIKNIIITVKRVDTDKKET